MITISQLRKEFVVAGGNVVALDNLSIDVEPGEFFVIIGASGSGKTTLLRAVAGLERPDCGTVKVADRTVFSGQPAVWVPPQDRGFGMVFQSYAVWPHMTVYENVALPLTAGAQKIPRNEVRARVEQALAMVQLDAQIDRQATLLSGGQQQRVALARAIAVNPKVLLMDEPLSTLDARLREEVRGKIRDLSKQLGATVLYVTHDQIEAMAIADKIAMMSFGKLLQFGSPIDIYRNPNSPEVAEFFGTVNWLPGEMGSAEGNIVKTEIGELVVSVDAATEKKVWVGLRPEHLAFSEDGFSQQQNHFQADLKNTVFLGDQYTFDAHAGNSDLIGKSRVAPILQNDKLHISIDPSDILVYPADVTNTKFIEASLAAA